MKTNRLRPKFRQGRRLTAGTGRRASSNRNFELLLTQIFCRRLNLAQGIVSLGVGLPYDLLRFILCATICPKKHIIIPYLTNSAGVPYSLSSFSLYLFFIILLLFVLFCFVLFCFVLFCFVLFCSLFCSLFLKKFKGWNSLLLFFFSSSFSIF